MHHQIKILEKLAQYQYEKSRAPRKRLGDCLDHLRSKKGFPTGDDLNLDSFLYPNNHNPVDARPDNPTRTRSADDVVANEGDVNEIRTSEIWHVSSIPDHGASCSNTPRQKDNSRPATLVSDGADGSNAQFNQPNNIPHAISDAGNDDTIDKGVNNPSLDKDKNLNDKADDIESIETTDCVSNSNPQNSAPVTIVHSVSGTMKSI